MAVTTDLVPRLSDIHLRNKHDVGNRLVHWALAKHDEAKDVIFSGPLPLHLLGDQERQDPPLLRSRIRGTKSRDGKPLTQFTIAGTDENCVPAEAPIDGDSFVVSAKEVMSPKHVRFGWHRIANPSLINF